MSPSEDDLKSSPNQKEPSLDYYSGNDVAQHYDSERFSTAAGRMMNAIESNAVLSNIPSSVEGPIVLDAGAGSGRFTIELAVKGIRVVACDYSRAMLHVIESKAEQSNLRCRIDLTRQDIRDLAFRDNVFDYVFSIRVSVNLDTRENLQRALRELVRVCKPNGTILLDIVNPKSLAAFGPTKSSMASLSDVRKLIASIPGVTLQQCSGRRLVSQTAYEHTPPFLLRFIDSVDSLLSRSFTSFCVRIYLVLRKT